MITTALALEWATQPAERERGGGISGWRSSAGFARYLQAADPRHEVPPIDLLPAKYRRAVPYLYSEAEIEALMHAARKIRSAAEGRDVRDDHRAAGRDWHADRRGGRA